MTSTLTIRELFVSTSDGNMSAGLTMPPPPAAIAPFVAGLDWDNMGGRVLDLLDINIVDVLLGGWKAHQEVRRELELTIADPSRTAVVVLAHHSIDSTHTPSIEFRAQGRKVFALSFPVELAFEVDAVELTLRTGAIREVRPGKVKVRGTVKLENTVLLERALAPIELPGRMVLAADLTAVL
jgi:hypothetical protein